MLVGGMGKGIIVFADFGLVEVVESEAELLAVGL
jgi:hypothetical protein